MSKNIFLKNYGFSLLLLVSILMGSCLGLIFKENAGVFKPFGDIFLNLLFTVVVPLVFFSISSAVAGMSDLRKLGKIMGGMIVIFIVTGIIAAVVMVIGVKLYPPAQGVQIAFDQPVSPENISLSQQLVKAFTVSDFN